MSENSNTEQPITNQSSMQWLAILFIVGGLVFSLVYTKGCENKQMSAYETLKHKKFVIDSLKAARQQEIFDSIQVALLAQQAREKFVADSIAAADTLPKIDTLALKATLIK